MAAPSDHLSHSEHSLPDPEVSAPIQPDTIAPSTPPLHHTKGDNYYNFPPSRIPSNPPPELSSSTTNVSMQPNPMYQDFPLKSFNSEKQIVVEKIKEGNPDALSTSTQLENNVRVYERIDSFLSGKKSFLPRHSYSPDRKGRDSDYQFLGDVRGDSPVRGGTGIITRVCLQALYSLILVITLFIAVIALVIAIICLLAVSQQSAQLAASHNLSYMLEDLEPLISKSTAYRMLVDNITSTQHGLEMLRAYSQQSFQALNQTENCSLRESVCLVENRNQDCNTDPLQVSAMNRTTGLTCVTSHMKAIPNIVYNNQTGAYTCRCFISIVQDETWSCSLYMWVCMP